MEVVRLGSNKPTTILRRLIMDWLKARWAERSSKNGLALIAVGVVALVFKPLLTVAAWAAIIYGAWQYWDKED